jgi:outer membrane protein assembly factor BamB
VAIHHRGVRGLFPGSVERAGLGAGVQGIDIGVKRTDVGAKVWQFTTGNSIDTSPAVANGVVYVSSGDNNVYALNASTGAKLWQTAVYLGTDAAVANGVVYVGSGDYNVYALNASTGAELWQFTTGNFVESSPVVANGVVYVGSDDNNIYAFKMTNPAEAPARPDPATLRPNLGLGK